jgi:hypothetical protein
VKTYTSPKLTTFGTIEALTQQPTFPGGTIDGTPPGKLETGEDAFGQRSRIESLDGPAHEEF